MPKGRHKKRTPTAVSKRQRRKALRRSQIKVTSKTIEVRRPISQRGRTHPIEAPFPGMPTTPQGVLVFSTAIKRFKYFIDKQILRIWWVNGGVYDYFNVPESIAITLAQAQSKGRFTYYNIRTSFRYKRIR